RFGVRRRDISAEAPAGRDDPIRGGITGGRAQGAVYRRHDGLAAELINSRSCCGAMLPGGTAVIDAVTTRSGKQVEMRLDLDGGRRVIAPLNDGPLVVGGGPLSPDGTMMVCEGFDDQDPGLNGLYTWRLR